MEVVAGSSQHAADALAPAFRPWPLRALALHSIYERGSQTKLDRSRIRLEKFRQPSVFQIRGLIHS